MDNDPLKNLTIERFERFFIIAQIFSLINPPSERKRLIMALHGYGDLTDVETSILINGSSLEGE